MTDEPSFRIHLCHIPAAQVFSANTCISSHYPGAGIFCRRVHHDANRENGEHFLIKNNGHAILRYLYFNSLSDRITGENGKSGFPKFWHGYPNPKKRPGAVTGMVSLREVLRWEEQWTDHDREHICILPQRSGIRKQEWIRNIHGYLKPGHFFVRYAVYDSEPESGQAFHHHVQRPGGWLTWESLKWILIPIVDFYDGSLENKNSGFSIFQVIMTTKKRFFLFEMDN